MSSIESTVHVAKDKLKCDQGHFFSLKTIINFNNLINKALPCQLLKFYWKNSKTND